MVKRDEVSAPLSEGEAALLKRVEDGMSYEVIAKTIGVPIEAIRARILAILKKIDKEELLMRYPVCYMQAEGIEGLDPTKDVIQVSKELGMSKKLTDGMRRRLLARKGLPAEEVGTLTDRQLVATLRAKLAESLSYLDPFVLAGASAKDLDAVIDGLIKNIQLLEGKPTSITSHEDRRQMNELLPLLILEARKRGVTLDVIPERIEPVTVVEVLDGPKREN